MEFVYPAIFETADEGGYTVTFPDFVGAVTEGDTLQEAFDMSMDCLGGLLFAYEEEGKDYPLASKISTFPQNTEEVFISLIKVDLNEYKKRVSEKPVRKTLYIPKGLNDAAEMQGINFSQILRDALKQQLNI